jgi:hypothetical protein
LLPAPTNRLTPATADLPAFPGISVMGGTLFGVPVITSSHCPGSTSGGDLIVLLDADSILLVDDGEIGVLVSDHGAIQHDSSP